jgi:hypothetical protein
MEREFILQARVGLGVVILKPGVPSAPAESRHAPVNTGVRSASYDADEEYWEALRRKNWNVGGIWRWCWKAGVEKPGQDEIPGSRSLGQGDWAYMKAVEEREETHE